MEWFRFDERVGKPITEFGSDFIMSKVVVTEEKTHVTCMHLPEGGRIGYHPAVVNQLLLVVKGEGTVCGEEREYVSISEGEAVFWLKGEKHETRTEKGLIAIVIEGDGVTPSLLASQ
ncbi:cupin [Pontibacillus chungwhensis BH030062]|uniref:Cupin n=1 Tax=Pontibacillus chungwhensis BH030062 TaxID=1385513 RepID=A0A0A2VF05_9BACI|nr:cupin [Pontibacillus chungwhensis]KGP92225.1 cupin [Pontibacillus chungwhensis BH030062]